MAMASEQVPEDRYHCVGCGRIIPWNGRGVFAYTCPCGARLFAGPKGYSLPASLIFGVPNGKELPHIDYYLGISDFVSAEKTKALEELKKAGCIWSWDCPKCKDETLFLRWNERRNKLIHFAVHPELKKVIDVYVPPIEKDVCDMCDVKPAEYTSLGGGRFCKSCADEMGLICGETNKIKR